jgi:putative GTP pyrophosphokinase
MVERDALAGISKSRVNLAGRRLRKHALGELELDEEELSQEREIAAGFRTAHGQPLAIVAANLRYHVEHESSLQPVEVGQRLKRLPTIIDKLTRHPTMALSTMQDVGGCRAVVANEAELRVVANRLRNASGWDISPREYDYIEDPKDDGYRALHLIERRHGCQIEVQLRTGTQHAWAELIESFDRSQAFAELKTGGGPELVREYYRLGAELMAARERGEEPDPATLEAFREIYEKVAPTIQRRRRRGT